MPPAVGSFFDAPLTTPTELSVAAAPAGASVLSKGELIARFQGPRLGGGRLYSVDFVRWSDPNYQPRGVPIKDMPAWLVVVQGVTEISGTSANRNMCAESGPAPSPGSCLPASALVMHGDRFYLYDPVTGAGLASLPVDH